MRIYLAYVLGINRIDTPKFSTSTEQLNWFNNLSSTIYIDTSYYPPHYTNKIRVDIDDVDFTSAYNYLWFTFREKTYYYFIDGITYISENLIELDITMDYIQTYMFNINVVNGIIERKFINRWVSQGLGWIINRNYIRENVSCKLYENQLKNYITSGQLVTILKSTEPISAITSSTDPLYNPFSNRFSYFIDTSPETIDDNIIVSPYHYTFYFTDYLMLNGHFGNIDFTLCSSLIYDAVNDNTVYDGYLLPIEFFNSMFRFSNGELYIYNFNNNTPVITSPLSLVSGIGAGIEWGQRASYSEQGDTVLTDYNNVKNFSIITNLDNPLTLLRNTNVGTAYSVNYMPIMYDENYIYLRYGNNDSYVDSSLHYEVSTTIILKSHLDLSTGNCVHGIWSQTNYLSLNEIDTNVLSIELVNNPWKEYVANNKNRWSSAGLKAGLSAVGTFVEVATSSVFAAKGINRVLKDKRSYTKKKQLLKVGAQRHLARMKDDYWESTIGDLSSGAEGIISPLVSQAIEDKNNQQKPESPKQAGNITSLYAQNKRIYYQWIKCRDYEQCAQYFHRNGYHIEEYIDNINNIFDYINNRYYFNILKMSDANIILTGCITDNETIDGITDRLFAGVRLWNVKSSGVNMGDFTYDNVELDYLQ